MMNKIHQLWKTHPLAIILTIAAIFRLIAAIFSKGYGMSDDHFLVIEVAQRWVDGHNDWFNRDTVAGHSIVYPGLHYILFYLLEKVNIVDPQFKMLIVRLIHAAYSMLIVWFGYLITLRLSNEKIAKEVGLILALFWILPIMSVRNLIEVVCIPPMMIGFYLALKENKWHWLLAGAMFGLAFTFRYQVSMMIAGVGLVLLIQRKWLPFGKYSLGFLGGAFIFQGIADWVAWGYPFASFLKYATYNAAHSRSYLVGPWYQYLGLILAAFIPPTSLLIGWGFLKTWKKYALLFVPVALFLIFHSYFPNKQERFILPILPFIPMLGMIGWRENKKTLPDPEEKKIPFLWGSGKTVRGLWIWFWVINLILLMIVTPTYTKKNRVETLYYLSHKDNVTGVVFESHRRKTPGPPRFYLNKDVPVYRFPRTKSKEDLLEEIDNRDFPTYIIFLGEKEIDNRIEKFEQNFSKELHFEKKITPSLVDEILYRMNPRYNTNQTSYIYRITNLSLEDL